MYVRCFSNNLCDLYNCLRKNWLFCDDNEYMVIYMVSEF